MYIKYEYATLEIFNFNSSLRSLMYGVNIEQFYCASST